MARVLVTGAGGFVGSAVVRALVRSGQEVAAGVRRRPAWPIPKAVELAELDLLDRASLETAVREHDAIVHCAVGAPRDTQVIIAGTRNILGAAADSGIGKFIHLSSVAVYGDVEGSIDESASTASPAGKYGQAKLVAEQACAEAGAAMAVAVLRPTLIYGPASAQWTTRYLDRLLAGGWGAMGAAGEGDCNLIHVDDLAGFICHLLDHPMAGLSTYNVNGRDVPTWNAYLEDLARAVDAPFASQFALPGPERVVLRKAARAVELVGGKLGVASEPLRRFIRQTPSGDELDRFARKVRYTTDRMVEAGYSPPTSLDEAISQIAAWHRAGRPVPGWH